MRAANARASSRRGQLATRRSACVLSKTSQGPPLRRETTNRGAGGGVSLVIAHFQLARVIVSAADRPAYPTGIHTFAEA